MSGIVTDTNSITSTASNSKPMACDSQAQVPTGAWSKSSKFLTTPGLLPFNFTPNSRANRSSPTRCFRVSLVQPSSGDLNVKPATRPHLRHNHAEIQTNSKLSGIHIPWYKQKRRSTNGPSMASLRPSNAEPPGHRFRHANGSHGITTCQHPRLAAMLLPIAQCQTERERTTEHFRDLQIGETR